MSGPLRQGLLPHGSLLKAACRRAALAAEAWAYEDSPSKRFGGAGGAPAGAAAAKAALGQAFSLSACAASMDQGMGADIDVNAFDGGASQEDGSHRPMRRDMWHYEGPFDEDTGAPLGPQSVASGVER